MNGDTFLVLLVIGLICLVVFNPINWVKLAVRLAPQAKRRELVDRMRLEAAMQSPEIAFFMLWIIDQAVGRRKEKPNGQA